LFFASLGWIVDLQENVDFDVRFGEGERRTDRERKTFHVETAPRPFFAHSSLDWTPFSQEHAGTPTWQGSFVRSSLQTFLFKTKLQTFLSEVPSDILA
jgi:hypothetical protein